MPRIKYSLAQIEAFVSVVECGSLTSAATRLAKDRTTLSELIDYLEVDLGYALFERSSRSLKPTAHAQRLYRQARLFLLEADAFAQIADAVPAQMTEELTLSYDPFVPRGFLKDLVSVMEAQNIRLHMICQSREAAEAGLNDAHVDVAICQAANRSIGSTLQWRLLGSVDLNFYAATGYFASGSPLSLRTLAAHPQLIPFTSMSEGLSARLRISDQLRIVNELDMLRSMLGKGYGWSLLPTHFCAGEWENVQVIETEVGHRGMTNPVVALWKPGGAARAGMSTLLTQLSSFDDIFSRAT